MLTRPRILMQQADASTATGAAATTSTSSESQANGTATAAAASASGTTPDPALVAAIAGAVRDSVFAEMRRAGVLEKPKTTNGTTAAPAASSAAATAAPAAGTDPYFFRPLDRAIASSGRQIDETAYKRIERSFADEKPTDATAWLNDYYKGMGIAAATGQASAAAAATNPNGSAAASAAPGATTIPAKVDPITSGGLVDIWHLTHQQLEQLGPSGVRREYERHLAEHRRQSGAPPIPKAAQRK